jgi:oxygen-independent coproporphyrinogen-3 oxidase
MVLSLKEELSQRKKELLSPIKSVYFGGGTPSLLNKEEFESLLEEVYLCYNVEPDAEVTLEANPENITINKAKAWKGLGINRLSVGLQSFKNDDLKWMNRGHNNKQNSACISDLYEAGFDNISVDLIYGLPGLKASEWEGFLKKVVSMGVEHVSAYCLTIEDKTKLKHDIENDKIKPLSESKQIEQFDFLRSFLKQNGYEHYEVSNFALNKNYSKHNRSYWERKEYIGIGPSAHSYRGKERRWNISNNHTYMSRGTKTQNWYNQEELSLSSVWNELFLTGFRTMWGVSKNEIKKLGGFTNQERKEVKALIDRGDLFDSGRAYVLSESGLLFADSLSESFFRVL